jgi:hypothetical protein
MDLRTSVGQRLGRCIRARETEHLMTGADQFLNHRRSDKARSTGNEDTHVIFLS